MEKTKTYACRLGSLRDITNCSTLKNGKKFFAVFSFTTQKGIIMQQTQQAAGGSTPGSHLFIGGGSSEVESGFTPLVPSMKKQVDMVALREHFFQHRGQKFVSPEKVIVQSFCRRHAGKRAVVVDVISCLLGEDGKPTVCQFVDGDHPDTVTVMVKYISDVSITS